MIWRVYATSEKWRVRWEDKWGPGYTLGSHRPEDRGTEIAAIEARLRADGCAEDSKGFFWAAEEAANKALAVVREEGAKWRWANEACDVEDGRRKAFDGPARKRRRKKVLRAGAR